MKCSVCNRKLNLAAVKCRCGNFHCAAHRMPEKHYCTFDFKTFGKEKIAKENINAKVIENQI